MADEKKLTKEDILAPYKINAPKKDKPKEDKPK